MAVSIGPPVAGWSKDDAARYLSSHCDMRPQDLLVSTEDVRYGYEQASTALHPFHASCEHCRRLVIARDILLGLGIPVTDAQGRLL